MGPAERALRARGVTLQELTFDQSGDDRGQQSYIIAEPLPDGSALFIALARNGMSFKDREAVALWMMASINNFLGFGPGRDGWYKRDVDGAWQMWGPQAAA